MGTSENSIISSQAMVGLGDLDPLHNPPKASLSFSELPSVLASAGMTRKGKAWAERLFLQRIDFLQRKVPEDLYPGESELFEQVCRKLHYGTVDNELKQAVRECLSTDVLQIITQVTLADVMVPDSTGLFDSCLIDLTFDALIIEKRRAYLLDYRHFSSMRNNPLYVETNRGWRAPRIKAAAAKLGISYGFVIGRLLPDEPIELEDIAGRHGEHCVEWTPLPHSSSVTNRVQAELFAGGATSWEELNRHGHDDDQIERAIAHGRAYCPKRDPIFAGFEGATLDLYPNRSTYLSSLASA
ncbi:hypothetical protein BTHE68_41220 [Burkholderia sp. THE68]|uniref:hypothetical protein n=1 Tax=Burkholderia sp. THE68 TaxID=758782 RepID=UPI001319A826|nr:hypothetical protein [Burkholderia sp. THE68]BBU30388.1 hypothetical protein BTHE68_41220 [Burkholderia sp. THE68]